jgi:flavodoxin
MMSRTAIIFYSRSGTGRAVAERLATASGWPAWEIRDAKPRAGLSGDLRCVVDSLFKRSPAYRYDGPELDVLDHVVLVAPVWLRSLAAPMRAFLKTEASFLPAYSVICVMSGVGGFRAVDDIATLAGKKPRSILLLKQADVLAEECDASLFRFKEQVAAATPAGRDDAQVIPAVD